MELEANILTSHFKGKLPLQSANQLATFLRKHCQGAGITVPTIFAADYAKFELLPLTWFSTFQSTITTLIPLYVNHLLPTATPGNYNGEAAIPTWTEATILTAIGDASRLPPPHRLTSAWCFQQYKILNMLRWVKDYGSQVARGFRSSTLGASGSWYNAEFMSGYMGYISAVWVNASYDAYAYYVGWNQSGQFFKRSQRFTKRFVNNGIYQASCDVYRFSEKSNWALGVKSWQPLVKSPTENAWSLISQSAESLFIDVKSHDDDEADGHLLEPALNTSYSNAVNSQTGFISVSKFDGANGFGFLE